nr:polysaccharide deacetylase family protein [uncultured Hyphomonas sp.]
MTEPSAHIISLTFDNFGEAFDLQNDRHPDGVSLGMHASAKVLPEILDHLEEVGLKATFFVEGWNAEHYGGSLALMAERGHEVSLHGWRHEHWSNQSESDRRSVLESCITAFDAIGLTPAGLRPPGGVSTPDTAALLNEFGLLYESSLGDTVTVSPEIVTLPFLWPHVDALYFEPLLANGRARLLGQPDVADVSVWEAALWSLFHSDTSGASYRAVIFHPYLLASDPCQMQVFKAFTECLSDWTHGSWLPCRAVADFARTNPHWVSDLRHSQKTPDRADLLSAF